MAKAEVKETEKKPVEQKTYYVASKGLTIHWKKERVGIAAGEKVILEGGRDINFQNGIHTTSDLDEQKYLDNYGGCISYEQWEQIHVSPAARQEKALRENASMKSELQSKDDELAKLRAELAAKK